MQEWTPPNPTIVTHLSMFHHHVPPTPPPTHFCKILCIKHIHMHNIHLTSYFLWLTRRNLTPRDTMRQSCDTVKTYTIRYRMTYKVYTKWHHVKVWDVITNDIIRRYETLPDIVRQYEALGDIETLQEMRHETDETPWQCPLNAIRRHKASCKTQEDIANNYHEISLTWDIVKHSETS